MSSFWSFILSHLFFADLRDGVASNAIAEALLRETRKFDAKVNYDLATLNSERPGAVCLIVMIGNQAQHFAGIVRDLDGVYSCHVKLAEALSWQVCRAVDPFKENDQRRYSRGNDKTLRCVSSGVLPLCRRLWLVHGGYRSAEAAGSIRAGMDGLRHCPSFRHRFGNSTPIFPVAPGNL